MSRLPLANKQLPAFADALLTASAWIVDPPSGLGFVQMLDTTWGGIV
jgi:hypothetical protein